MNNNDARLILETANSEFPPPSVNEGFCGHHNLILDDNGFLVLTVWYKNKNGEIKAAELRQDYKDEILLTPDSINQIREYIENEKST